jgi:hypothetical protein
MKQFVVTHRNITCHKLLVIMFESPGQGVGECWHNLQEGTQFLLSLHNVHFEGTVHSGAQKFSVLETHFGI